MWRLHSLTQIGDMPDKYFKHIFERKVFKKIFLIRWTNISIVTIFAMIDDRTKTPACMSCACFFFERWISILTHVHKPIIILCTFVIEYSGITYKYWKYIRSFLAAWVRYNGREYDTVDKSTISPETSFVGLFYSKFQLRWISTRYLRT